MPIHQQRKEVMQRIRLGLGGLAGVLLLIGLADFVVDKIRSDEIPAAAVEANASADAGSDQPAEPLAELGVTPASDSGNQPVVADLQPDPNLREPMDRTSPPADMAQGQPASRQNR